MIAGERMIPRMSLDSARFAWILALLATLCVLAVFFFPGIEGPYSAVHGPVTALLSVRAATVSRFALVHAALTILGSLIPVASLLLPSFWSESCKWDSFSNCASPTCISNLRC